NLGSLTSSRVDRTNSASNRRSNARSHRRRNAASFRRWVYTVFREIPAALQARTIFGFRRSAARSASRHGNALGTRFEGRFDIIPRNVQMNVTTGFPDATGHFKGPSEGLTLA